MRDGERATWVGRAGGGRGCRRIGAARPHAPAGRSEHGTVLRSRIRERFESSCPVETERSAGARVREWGQGGWGSGERGGHPAPLDRARLRQQGWRLRHLEEENARQRRRKRKKEGKRRNLKKHREETKRLASKETGRANRSETGTKKKRPREDGRVFAVRIE